MKKLLRPVVVALSILAVGTVVARRLGFKVGGNTIVRCRQGHLFTTLWIPGVKLKAIDLGVARFQHCPVGNHWTLVLPVREANLTDEEKASAASRRDIRIP
jgi:S-adenosylmethionine:tRNA-ribosyltransferase-isomerase (queuine synthetase)